MRLSLVFGVCVALLFTMTTSLSFAQTGSKSSKESAQKSGKTLEACNKCCSDQVKSGMQQSNVSRCVSRCMAGEARNC
jgi:hypothetical protein